MLFSNSFRNIAFVTSTLVFDTLEDNLNLALNFILDVNKIVQLGKEFL
jgi:hypothetical protein